MVVVQLFFNDYPPDLQPCGLHEKGREGSPLRKFYIHHCLSFCHVLSNSVTFPLLLLSFMFLDTNRQHFHFQTYSTTVEHYQNLFIALKN